MRKIHYAAASFAAFFLLSGLPVMPLSAQECVPDIRLKIKVYLEGALRGAAALPPRVLQYQSPELSFETVLNVRR